MTINYKRRLLLCLAAIIFTIDMTAQALHENTDVVFHHPWSHKRVAYLGDSLTDPKNNGSKKKYWGFLEEWLGIEPLVYGRSGWQWNGMVRQAEQLKKEHGDSVDAIIIFVGTNDFNAGVPIGKWWNETEEDVLAAVHAPKAIVKRKKRIPDTNEHTFRGRINHALGMIKQLYPTRQIVLLTPIHRAFAAFSDNNIQPTEEYQNSCGEYFDEYVKSVKEAGNIWAVPVIDLNSLSGLFPLMHEHEQYFHDADKDMLHPNDAGQRRIARTLYYQLSVIPVEL